MLPDKQNSFYDLLDNEAIANQFMDNNQQQKLLLKFPPYYPPQSFLYYPFSTQYFTDQFNYPMPMVNQQQQLEIQKPNDQMARFLDLKKETHPPQKQKKIRKIDQKTQMFVDKVQVEMKVEKKQAQNLKNTYINKISQLMSQENNTKDSEKQLFEKCKKNLIIGDSKQQKFKLQENESNQKLARNRECARNSRKRKKIYIELLENKVKQLTEELSQVRGSNQKAGTNAKIFDVEENDFQNILLQFIETSEQFAVEMDNMLNSENKLQFFEIKLREVKIQLQNREQANIIENQRKKAASFMMQQFLNVAIPTHQKYLIKSQALFASDAVNQQLQCEEREWEQELMKQINQTEEQHLKFHRIRPQLSNEIYKFENITFDFANLWKELKENCTSLQDLVSEMSELFTEKQIALFFSNTFKQQQNEDLTMNRLCQLADQIEDGEQQDAKKNCLFND